MPWHHPKVPLDRIAMSDSNDDNLAGDWRRLHMVILEARTGCPKELLVALRQPNSAPLALGGVLECTTLGVVYSGIDGVKASNRDDRGS